MWTCPKCDRNFKGTNQSHMCTSKTIDDIFEGKPIDLALAFDELLINVIDWEPCSVGNSVKAIIFAKEKAWLIVKPMSKQLDIKFYLTETLQHPLVVKNSTFGNKTAHHIRIKSAEEVTPELIALLRIGYDAA